MSVLKKFSLAIAFSLNALYFVNAQTEVKGNLVFAPVGIINLAVEKPVSKHIALEGEVFVSPWKSFTGRHLQIYLGTVEGRYYFKENHSKWFVGGYIAGGAFDIQKWNYWNESHVIDEDGAPIFNADGSPRITSLYQRGFAYVLGVDVGYKLRLSDHFNLEAFLGVGTVQGFYRGYYQDTHERYDKPEKFNKSGEFIPTRGGLMLSYIFK